MDLSHTTRRENDEWTSNGRRVVVCGSMTFFGEMCRVKHTLATHSVGCVLPDAEDHVVHSMTSVQFEAFRREASFAHLRRVRHPATFAILAINFDKHGIRDYIGPSTFAEIAVATASHKKVFVLNDFPAAYAQELTTWQAIRLNGRLEPLVREYITQCAKPTRQLTMFPRTASGS